MIGRDHRLIPKNNQDSWGVWQSEELTVAIVADGCGSGLYSEVGAKLGCSILGSYLYKECSDPRMINWRQAQQALLSQLDITARVLGGDYRRVVQDYFLFTLVGVVIGRSDAVFFAQGDGLLVVNDDLWPLEPLEGNQPAYIGYNLVAESVDMALSDLQLRSIYSIPTSRLHSFMIATDGVNDLAQREGEKLPGLEQTVPALNDFWHNDRYFRGNSELLSRQLKLIGRDWPQSQPQPGLLSDDTTMVVGRCTSTV